MITQAIITEISRDPNYLALCQSTARPDLADDLYQEFLVALMTFPNLEEVYQKEWFPHLCTCIIKNLYHSPTSTFFQAYRAASAKTRKLLPQELEIPEEIPALIPQSHETRLDKMITLLEKLDWRGKEIRKAAVKRRSPAHRKPTPAHYYVETGMFV